MNFDFFGFMVMLAVVGGGILIWGKFFRKTKGEKVVVDFTEIIGGVPVSHEKSYEGMIYDDKDILTIPNVVPGGLKRPVPPRRVMVSTKGGYKKLYLVKFESDRYGFRLPSVKNTVFIYKRDDKGNIIKNPKGTPKLVKHRWTLVDDVIEPDVKHWEEHIQNEIREKHRLKKEAFEKWIGPISMAMIFLLAIILNSQSTREVRMDKQIIMENAQQLQEDAKQTQQGLNRLLDRISGTTVFDDEEQRRADFLNQTGT